MSNPSRFDILKDTFNKIEYTDENLKETHAKKLELIQGANSVALENINRSIRLIKEKLVSLKSKKEDSEKEKGNLLKSLGPTQEIELHEGLSAIEAILQPRAKEELDKKLAHLEKRLTELEVDPRLKRSKDHKELHKKIEEIREEIQDEKKKLAIEAEKKLCIAKISMMQESIKCFDEQIEELESDLQEFEKEKKELEGIEQNQQVNINLSEQKTEQVNFKNKAQSNPQGIR